MHMDCMRKFLILAFAISAIIVMSICRESFSAEDALLETNAGKGSVSEKNLDAPTNKQMAGFEQFAVRIRGLEFKKPVAYRSIKKGEVKELLDKKLDEQYSAKEFNNKVEAYVKLGLFRSPEGVREMMLGMLSEQIAGFYDTDNHVLYTISDIGFEPQFDAMIYIHELTHALQDQHFNINSLGIRNKKNDDQVTAVMSLIEGDATLVLMEYFTKYNKFSIKMLLQAMAMDSGKLNAAPYVLRRELLFPYVEGMALIAKIHTAKGWKGVDEAYKKPPETTEQVLHPEKYITNRDEPVEVKLPNIRRKLTGKWRLLDDNVMGELNTQILFDIFLGKWSSKKPSAGWDGDRYAVFKNDANGETILVWDTVWDREKDAKEFFVSYLNLLEKKYLLKTFNREDKADFSRWNSEGLFIAVARKNNRILTIETPDEKLMTKILASFPDYQRTSHTTEEGEK
jgi:hypothetical protein